MAFVKNAEHQAPVLFPGGWYVAAEKTPSPFFNQRPAAADIRLLVIHNISLPAGCFGLPYIRQLFLGCLDVNADPSFADLAGLEVSAHFLIDRQGRICQFVATGQRAWHAGVSSFAGVDNCNDYSIGIELEGADDTPFTDAQYQALAQLSRDLMNCYGIDARHIVGHSDIAPGRKTDPGPCFDWPRYRRSLES